MQQDDRKKRIWKKRLCVTNVTGLLLSSEDQVLIFTNVFWSFTKNFCLKASEVTSNKIIIMLVTQDLPSSFLSRPVAYKVHYYVTKEVIKHTK